ncbi:MAG: CehA/McbA family metallohydrolase [Planctomycetota bacterium]|nr:CehA/McbA family metallohydrolase [Planctomycetota bacterium]
MSDLARSLCGGLVVCGLAWAVATCGGNGEPAIAPEIRQDAPPPEPPEDESEDPREDPPYARWDMVEGLRADRDMERHSSDGGGRAWIEEVDGVVPPGHSARPGRWTIVYEAGPEGVAVGGRVVLIVSPFWGWSPPQVDYPRSSGYSTAECEAEGVTVDAEGFNNQLWIEIGGRALVEGERLRITYGAGPAGAVADRYAERESPLWIGVDGDGDGVHAVLADSPRIQVLPGPARQLVVTIPSTAEPGDTLVLRIALLDGFGNAGCAFEGTIDFPGTTEGLELPESVALAPEDRGLKTVAFTVQEPGVHRFVARAVPAADPESEGLLAQSNPLHARVRSPRILWGDLHGHSNLSDGTGTPEDFYAYARDVAGLDFAALTDHDHYGMLKLDAHPDMWERIKGAAQSFHEPGSFVTLLGYEWTSWIHGHRHVIYFGDEGEVYSSLDEDERYESPAQLWAALRGQPALTFAHHSACGPIATNWDFAPDPVLEPVTEISSVHGTSEAMDTPARIYSPVPGNFVRDVLDRGYRLGFIGSGDSHDGHPGLAQLAGSNSGLAAVLSEDLTREGVLEALRARRCYATNGPRILLRTALDGNRMGSTVTPKEGEPSNLYVHVVGVDALHLVDVIRSGEIVHTIDAEGAFQVEFAVDLAELSSGEYVYVRVIQEDLGLAWSSPFYVD